MTPTRRYREALEVPAVVAPWISEVPASADAEEGLRRGRPTPLTEDDIRAMVESVADIVGVLEAAEPQKKADLYDGPGLSLTYEQSKRRVLVEADLGGVRPVGVGGGI